MSFEELKNEWDNKLKDSGFEDIEYGNGMLKGALKLNSETQNYYGHARKFSYDNNWYNAFEELVWTLHSDGVSLSEMAKLIKVSYREVRSTVEMLKGEFADYVIKEVEEKIQDS